MKTLAGTLAAPFPYFGGKSLACSQVWEAFGDVRNYVEPFAGSAAMLLGAPDEKKFTATINDFDGFVANFWRAIAYAPDEVAHYADWPVNETDLFARHSWLVRQRETLTDRLHGDPEWFDAKIAGWWCWGACAWIRGMWCIGQGPWVHDGETIVDSRKLPSLGNAGKGIKRQIPNLAWGGGINRQLPHLGDVPDDVHPRTVFIKQWFRLLHDKLRDVRVASGDWSRVLGDSVTTNHGLTAVFLDPPYTKGDMDYGAGGMGQGIADDVRAWCIANGSNDKLRIVLCGHAGEHDELLSHGWHIRTWTALSGFARTEEAVANRKSETLWCNPHCIPPIVTMDLFSWEE